MTNKSMRSNPYDYNTTFKTNPSGRVLSIDGPIYDFLSNEEGPCTNGEALLASWGTIQGLSLHFTTWIRVDIVDRISGVFQINITIRCRVNYPAFVEGQMVRDMLNK